MRGDGSWILTVGALSGAAAVCLGAFGAHGLKNVVKDPKRLKTWETGAHYHLIHSLAIYACGLHTQPATLAAKALIFGTVLFSGSLYTLVLADLPIMGAVAPIGGTGLIAGWVLLAMHAS